MTGDSEDPDLSFPNVDWALEGLPAGVVHRDALPRAVVDLNTVAWSPNGDLLAIGREDGRLVVWDVAGGRLVVEREITPDADGARVVAVRALAWHPDGEHLYAAGPSWASVYESAGFTEVHRLRSGGGSAIAVSSDGTTLAIGGWSGVELWDTTALDDPVQTLVRENSHYAVAWSPDGSLLAFGGRDGSIELLHVESGSTTKLIGHESDTNGLAWLDGDHVVSGSSDKTIKVWSRSGSNVVSLEGHTSSVQGIDFSPCGRLMASKASDETRLWRTDSWQLVGRINDGSTWPGAVRFHPSRPVLATADAMGGFVRIWDLDIDELLGVAQVAPSVQHVTAKVVLVGDSGVGKTGLGWRLAHDEFKDHSSTHGQQFWVIESLRTRREDGTECEAVLWDLAGQPDYRLIHALFIDDAELALVLFDPAHPNDALHGVEYWLHALGVGAGGTCRTILVGARMDRGSATITNDEIEAFCRHHGIEGGYLPTSAASGDGLAELVARMRDEIRWDGAAATVTTTTFQRIKEHVLGLKERERVIVEDGEIRQLLQDFDASWRFTDAEMITAIGHLAKHGYVQIIRTAAGGRRILLRPELLNGLASSIVIEARRNVKGLGSLDEAGLRSGQYALPEIAGMSEHDREVLIDAAIVLFLEHNICFRESVGSQSLLVFPELINRMKPAVDGPATVDDVSYTVSGPIANVYAALVVLLGYTNTFTRTDQWRSQAQYEVGEGEICGFRQVAEREGELDLVLYYGTNVSPPTRLVFQGLFERILLGRKVAIVRYPTLACVKCQYRQDRAEVIRRASEGHSSLFCANCGKKLEVPIAQVLETPSTERRVVDEASEIASLRTTFEAVLAQLVPFVSRRDAAQPRCFVSYAWGDAAQEQWVETRLARDLRNAAVDVILDRWDNAAIGSSIGRFISRIAESEKIVVVGTPRYREKYENKDEETGTIVSAEVDLIHERLTGTERQKSTVLPILLDGDKNGSFPPLVSTRVFADFRDEVSYFSRLFDLILTIYDVPFDDMAVADLRERLSDTRKSAAVPTARR